MIIENVPTTYSSGITQSHLPNGLWSVTVLQPITVRETEVLRNFNSYSNVTGHMPLGKGFRETYC